MRSAFIKSALIPLSLLIAAPVAAQEQSKESQQESQEQQTQERQQKDRQKQASQQARRAAAEQASAEGLCPECQAKIEGQSSYSGAAVRRHYLAGFVRGYYSGFSDGVDDYVIVVGKQGDQRAETSGDRRDSSDRQSQNLRDRLRQNSRSRMSEQMKSDGASRFNQSQQRQSQRTHASQQRVSGEVTATKRTKLKNDDQVHLILLVTTDQGQRRIVDAGPDSEGRQSIRKGDKIVAEGRMKRTSDGVPVLMSQRIGKAVASSDERDRAANQRGREVRQQRRSSR
jgi:hypothetical protein